MKKKLVAALACRNNGSRLYGKPLQNLDIENNIRIIDHIIDHLNSIQCIDEIVLGISKGIQNKVFISIAEEKRLKYVVGSEEDVLDRLIECGKLAEATDIFRVTSESPFLYSEPVEELWNDHVENNRDGTFFDEIIDGCGFEIIKQRALEISHSKGNSRHQSELCTLYMRENENEFNIEFFKPDDHLIRKDLRLTVDNPEDLVVCRKLYEEFKNDTPVLSIDRLINYLDKNPSLKQLIAPFTETGYKQMYVRSK